MTGVDQGADAGPVSPRAATRLAPLPLAAVTLTDGFLGRLQRDNATTSIVRGQDHLLDSGAWTNFENAAARREGQTYHGPVFEDGEVFKWMEAAAWEHGRSGDERIGRWLADHIDLIARAQEEDGYMSTFIQVTRKRERYEWISYDHEIFDMATLIQAAVARFRSSGATDLLAVAVAAADHLDATFGEDRRRETCGHPLVEMALVELYRVTGERRYLDLASFFVEVRGHGTLTDPTWQGWTSTYFSDRVPVRQTRYPEGHAVRAVYLAAGATDVAIETGDAALLDALRRQWDNMVEAKMYVNGSLGSRWEGESFGDPYELPNDRGYGETCAAIASIQWSWRLLLATGEPRYADLIERQLYNAVLSGVSLDGNRYFYVNALQVHDGAHPYDDRMAAAGRQEWFGCSCCPTNLMRTLASLHHYLATSDGDGTQIHQYGSAEITSEHAALSVSTDYPWHGDVEISVTSTSQAPWELALRIPAWAEGATLQVAGADPVVVPAGTYARTRRTWDVGDVVRLRLPMAPRTSAGHHRVDPVRGAVAIERGPLLYAVEQIDQPTGLQVDDLALVGELREGWSEALGGIPVVTAAARNLPDGVQHDLVAIPYFMWANRDIGPMKVWIPQQG